MTLSRLATVSTDAGASFDRKQPKLHRDPLGKTLLNVLLGGEAARADFETRLSPAARGAWEALATESNPDLFFEGLISLAQGLQERQPQEAARLYAVTAEFLSESRGSLKGFGDKARAHLQAVSGRGGLGPRAELLLSRLIHEATDPAALFAMGLGTQAFRWGRVWTALRLGKCGVATRAVANGAGFFLETAAFTLGYKGAATALGRSQDFAPGTLARDWASNALFLGPLKAMGAASRWGLSHTLGRPRLAALTQELGIHGLLAAALPQGGMLSGILIAQELQQRFGLREAQDTSARFADAFATLLQLHAGNGLFAAALGPGFQRSQAEADGAYRSWRGPGGGSKAAQESIFDAYSGDDAPTLPYSRPAYAGGRPYRDAPERPQVLMMAGENTGGPKHRWTVEDFENLGKFRFGLNVIESEAIASTIHPDQRHMMLFSRLLQKVEFPDRETRTHAFCRLGHIMKHSNEGGEAGGYVNWLTRKVFNSYLERQPVSQASALLQFLVEGGRLHDYEKLLADSVPPARLAMVPPWILESQRAKYPSYQRIRQLKIPDEAKRILFRWVYTQAKAKQSEPHFLPEDSFIDRIGEALFFPGYGELIGRALRVAEASPLPFYRLQRLYGILKKTDALTGSKLMELGDPNFQLVGSKVPKLPVPILWKNRPSQFNAYLGEEAPLDLLAELQHRMPALLDPKQAEARRAARMKLFESIEAAHSRLNLEDPAFWAYAFKLLGDAYSRRIAADIEAGKFELRVLEVPEFVRRCREMDLEDAVDDNAFFLHSGVTGGKPLMMIKKVAIDHYSFQVRGDPIFAALGKIVHEYQHFLDIDPAQNRTQPVVYVQEMRAHLREALWRAQYGDTTKLASFHRDGNSGLALHWRDKFESLYGHHFKRD
ncbi:hypothetical protein FBR05_02400 [Deltaproteobacteria bacterium PRO3]|nr:hypothetical protein [Deltaproteobacteria bacterium PRO3]